MSETCSDVGHEVVYPERAATSCYLRYKLFTWRGLLPAGLPGIVTLNEGQLRRANCMGTVPHRAAAAVAAATAADDDVTSLHSCSLALLRTGLPGDPWIKDLALITSGHLAHRADCPLCAWLTATFSLPLPPPAPPAPCGLHGHFTCPADEMLVFTQVVQWLVFLGHRS